MHTPATLTFDLAHRAERVTNISPASDAFVLFTLATLFFTIGCFVMWMWFIWRRSRKAAAQSDDGSADEVRIHETVLRSSHHSSADAEEPPAPWQKPADWWKERPRRTE